MMKLRMMLIVLLFSSCSNKRVVPRGIIEPEKMQSVFWDYIRADVYTRDYLRKDSAINDSLENLKLQNRVFNYYNISRQDFYRSYKYYVEHSELMRNMIDSMVAKQNRRPVKNLMKVYE